MNNELIACEIRDAWNVVESATLLRTPVECHKWYAEHGVAMVLVTMSESGFTFKKL